SAAIRSSTRGSLRSTLFSTCDPVALPMEPMQSMQAKTTAFIGVSSMRGRSGHHATLDVSCLLMRCAHVCGHFHPRMHALLVDRDLRGREFRVGEYAYGYRHEFGMAFDGVVDGDTAGRTEPESGSRAFVPDADVLDASAHDGDRFAREAGL